MKRWYHLSGSVYALADFVFGWGRGGERGVVEEMSGGGGWTAVKYSTWMLNADAQYSISKIMHEVEGRKMYVVFLVRGITLIIILVAFDIGIR